MGRLFENIAQPDNAWFVQLRRQIYPIGKICTVRRGPLKGLRFRVVPAMGFTYAWGIGASNGLLRLGSDGVCVYDVGANCGQSTLSLARLLAVPVE